MLDLAAESDRLLDFAERARHPDGGFAWLDESGTPDLARPRELLITARMTHCFALAHLLGRPGAAELADHGIAALEGVFRDRAHGGWLPAEGSTDKRAYEHVFVVLAASSAVAAGLAADALLADALDVLEIRFWDERAGALVDTWDRGWTTLEPYRGANANMHGVEAMLAVGWRERALRVAERLVHRNRPRINEHFDADWQPLPDYHRDQPAHPFRPYGATVGHWFEWARLCAHLESALGAAAPAWLREDARELFARGAGEGWDGDGFVYTVDWDGRPVIPERLHWVLCEAIGAAAVLGEDALQARWWELAERCFVDREHGSWHHELDPDNRPASRIWPGKPDVYHAYQATLLPRLPLSPSLAESARLSISAGRRSSPG